MLIEKHLHHTVEKPYAPGSNSDICTQPVLNAILLTNLHPNESTELYHEVDNSIIL